jgi:hypothetical protein
MQRVASTVIVSVLLTLVEMAPAAAQVFTSGSTGADGAFTPTTSTTLTLPPNGIFNFTTITIPAGVTIRFARNTGNTPVILLATGLVTIAGTLDVSGANGGFGVINGVALGPNGGAAGPGGFDGGAGGNGVVATGGGAGLGPGGGAGAPLPASSLGVNGVGGGGGFLVAGAASNNSPPNPGGAGYGTSPLVPLVGGSGGGGGSAPAGHTGGGGGGGGGAILVASSTGITFSAGTILAKGGLGVATSPVVQVPGPGSGGGGSGGAVRLVAPSITGTGTINASGGLSTAGPGISAGSAGRVRLEAFTNTAAITYAATPLTAISTSTPLPALLATAPSLRITAIDGVTVPASPSGAFATPDAILPVGTVNPVEITVSGSNIPPGTAVTISVSGQVGVATSTTATLTGTLASSSASASVTVPTNQASAVSVWASFTLTAATDSGSTYDDDGDEAVPVIVVSR